MAFIQAALISQVFILLLFQTTNVKSLIVSNKLNETEFLIESNKLDEAEFLVESNKQNNTELLIESNKLNETKLPVVSDEKYENNRVVIGVLTQESCGNLGELFKYDSYIAGSYVKVIEHGGARVAPIWIGQNESYYRNILKKVNGVLLPGGGADFSDRNGYADAGRIIYRIAKEMNDAGDFFPVWGTCLGLELMTFLEANDVEHRVECNSMNQTAPLTFKPNFRESRLFANIPQDIVEILEKEEVTSHFHMFCVTEQELARVNLTDTFRVMALNKDVDGLVEFISALEHKHYPFYAIQFHPDKVLFEFSRRLRVPHSSHAVYMSHYFVDFFINEARKNRHEFDSYDEEAEYLIFNWAPTFTARLNQASWCEVSYFFSKKDMGLA